MFEFAIPSLLLFGPTNNLIMQPVGELDTLEAPRKRQRCDADYNIAKFIFTSSNDKLGEDFNFAEPKSYDYIAKRSNCTPGQVREFLRNNKLWQGLQKHCQRPARRERKVNRVRIHDVTWEIGRASCRERV